MRAREGRGLSDRMIAALWQPRPIAWVEESRAFSPFAEEDGGESGLQPSND